METFLYVLSIHLHNEFNFDIHICGILLFRLQALYTFFHPEMRLQLLWNLIRNNATSNTF